MIESPCLCFLHRYDSSSGWVLRIFCHLGWKWLSAVVIAGHSSVLGWQIHQWPGRQLWPTMGERVFSIIQRAYNCSIFPPPYPNVVFLVISDIWAEEDCGVHMSHGLLHQYCDCTVGRFDHLQDQKKLCLPARNEVSKRPINHPRLNSPTREYEV